MSTRPRSLIGRFAATALLAGVLFPVAVPAGAAECPPGEGVTVVVDFGSLGGGVEVGCAPTATTGFDALAQAGFDVVRVQQSPSFVCRIDGRPDAGSEDCVDVPPASAYWSYWTADAGGDWKLQQRGASSAIAGDVEGWAFADGTTSPPDHPVPAAPTTTTTTTTTTSTTTTTTTTTTTIPPTTTTVAPPSTTRPPEPTTSTTTSSTSTSTTTSTTVPAPTSPSVPSTTTHVVTDSPEAAAPSGPGPTGFVLGAAAVVATATAAFVVARRRGRDTP